jgi:preprotein translocase subunit SecA
MFQDMMNAVREEIVSLILRVQIVKGGEELLHKKKNITYGKEPPKAGKPAPIKQALKVGRNDPCPCGSGKKYKKCCGKNE